MKNILLVPISLIALGLSISANNKAFGQYQSNHVTVSPISNNVNIQADANNAAFDVNALADFVRKSADPQTLETNINAPGNLINNLDLDKDGKIDYLTVTETGANQLQIQDAAVNPSVLVARLTITPDNSSQMANLQIDGTPAYCGPSYYYYQPRISFGTMLFMAYLLRPHHYYVPMYGYGHYPRYYVSHRTVVRNYYRPTSSSYIHVPSGNSGRGFSRSTGGPSRSSLSAPSSSGRSFSSRSANKPVGSGGFGSNRTSGSGGGFGAGTNHGFSSAASGSRSSSSSSGTNRGYSAPSSTHSNYSAPRSSYGSSATTRSYKPASNSSSSRGSSWGGRSSSSGSSSWGSRSSSSRGSSWGGRSSSSGSRSSSRSFGRRR